MSSNNEVDNTLNGNNNSKPNSSNNEENGTNTHTVSNASAIQCSDNRLHPREKQQMQHQQAQQMIAKPLASRPAPSFLHHTLSHPHLHSLLAHCRSPYIGAGGFMNY